MIALFLTPSLLFDRVSGNELVRIKRIDRRNDMSAQEETTPTKKNYKKRGLKYLLIAVVLLAIWLILTLAHIPSGFILAVNTILKKGKVVVADVICPLSLVNMFR